MADLFGDGRQVYYTHDTIGNHFATRLNPDGTLQNLTWSGGQQVGNGGWAMADLFGDGWQVYYTHNTSGQHFATRFSSLKPDLLTSITNPIGGQITVTYKPLTDNTVYAKDTVAPYIAVYPVMDLQAPCYVVATHTVNDGLGNNYAFTYNYGGAKEHLLGRGRLGFRWMYVQDSTTGVQNTTFFRQDFPFIGVVSSSETDDSTGVMWAQVVNTWSSRNNHTPVTNVYFVFLSRVDNYEYDGQLTARQIAQTFDYDTYGNPIQTYSLGDVAVIGDERTEQTDWVIDTTNWIHRPKRIALIAADGVTVLREKWLSYDGLAWGLLGTRGLLTKEESRRFSNGGLGDARNPVVTYGYDAYGNRTQTMDPRGCPTTTTFDTTYQTFPATVTTCLNHQTTLLHDPNFGVITSQTDPNNQTTTYNYDTFGRLTKVTGPLDTASANGTVSYLYLNWGTPSSQHIEIRRTTQHGTANYIWTEDYFDGLGRAYKIRSQGPGTQVIRSDALFGSRGLVTSKSAPYFEVGETAVTTTFTYDPLGRQTRVDFPDGTFATTSYNRGVIRLTDENGHVKRRSLDAYGRLIQVDEVNGLETYVTTYQYNAAGDLLVVTNQALHQTQMGYDLLGRKTSMSDPNMGSWSYDYDLGGNLLTQRDAKNQTLTFTYDLQSRLTTKTYPDLRQITWTYDEPMVPNSKGRLTRVTDLAATTSFTYDALGRATQTQRVIDSLLYTMTQTYDALNRITSETFPDTEMVTYNYDAPWLSNVPGYINSITYNARGQKTQVQYANLVATTWTYNPQNFRVTNRLTSGTAAGTIQNLTYGYDNVGNITSITDPVFTATRTFQYDALNRLTQAIIGTGLPAVTQDYSYDAIGNILNKAGIVYTYGDPTRPSAVTSTSDGRTYTYDANGNMLTAGGKTYAWDYDNRLNSVSNAPNSATMSYDYTGIRVKKISNLGTTLYPFSGYETTGGVVTKYIRIGIEIFASKKGNNKLFYHNDHLGGINVTTDINGLMAQLVEYDPWGKISREEGIGDSIRRFTGKQLDAESGLLYYGGRYYDPELGRFISPDPFVARPDDPQNLNRYSYVENNPVNYIDPSGYASFWKKIGRFFKNLFRHPGRLFASIFVGVVTGFIAGPAVLGLASSSWALGAIGAAAAGATSAGLNGGNPLLGALWGGALGFIGGGGLSSSGFLGAVEGAEGGGLSLGDIASGAALFAGAFAGEGRSGVRTPLTRNNLLQLASGPRSTGDFFRTGDEETIPAGMNPNVRRAPAGGGSQQHETSGALNTDKAKEFLRDLGRVGEQMSRGQVCSTVVAGVCAGATLGVLGLTKNPSAAAATFFTCEVTGSLACTQVMQPPRR